MGQLFNFPTTTTLEDDIKRNNATHWIPTKIHESCTEGFQLGKKYEIHFNDISEEYFVIDDKQGQNYSFALVNAGEFVAHIPNSQLKPVIYHILKHYTSFPEDHFEKIYKEYDLGTVFLSIEKCNIIQAYKSIFLHLPDDMKYEAFLDAYLRSEYYFGKLTINILESLKKLRPESVIEELGKHADDKGFITIYRGECTKSSQFKKAISWSLDKEKAIWFAKRFLLEFSDVGYVYEAKVNINNVIGFTQDRSESEVIVRSKYLELISKNEVYKS